MPSTDFDFPSPGGSGSCGGLPAVHHLCRVSELRRPPLRLVCPVQHVSRVSLFFIFLSSGAPDAAEGLKPQDLSSPTQTADNSQYVRARCACVICLVLMWLDFLHSPELFLKAVRAKQRVVTGPPDPSETARTRQQQFHRCCPLCRSWRPASERGIDLWLGSRCASPTSRHSGNILDLTARTPSHPILMTRPKG